VGLAAIVAIRSGGTPSASAASSLQHFGSTELFVDHCSAHGNLLVKREVLFGGGTPAGLLADAITTAPATAPATAPPLEAATKAMDALGREAFTSERRAFSTLRRAVIAANPELREREALKGLALTAAMTKALEQHGVSRVTACVAAELGSLAIKTPSG
jgi:hypothetical protein